MGWVSVLEDIQTTRDNALHLATSLEKITPASVTGGNSSLRKMHKSAKPARSPIEEANKLFKELQFRLKQQAHEVIKNCDLILQYVTDPTIDQLKVIDELRSEIDQVRNRFSLLKRDLNFSKARVTELENDIRTKDDTISSMTDQLRAKEKLELGLKETIAQKDTERRKLRDEIASLNKRLSETIDFKSEMKALGVREAKRR